MQAGAFPARSLTQFCLITQSLRSLDQAVEDKLLAAEQNIRIDAKAVNHQKEMDVDIRRFSSGTYDSHFSPRLTL